MYNLHANYYFIHTHILTHTHTHTHTRHIQVTSLKGDAFVMANISLVQ